MELTPPVFIAGLVISTALSLLVFSHASKHGSKHATAWGIAAFALGAFGAAVYYARYWWKGRSGRSDNRRY